MTQTPPRSRPPRAPTRRRFVAELGSLAALGAVAPLGVPLAARAADSYPSKPVRWVVGYPAGAATDFVARTVAAGLGPQLGQTVVIDNKPGASGILGATDAAKSPGDGYTLLTADNGILIYNTALFKKLAYEPAKDFAPIGLICRIPIFIAAHPNVPWHNARDLVAAMKARPNEINYASGGIGTPHNLAMEMLKERAGVQATAVQYRGGAPALNDVLGNQVPLILIDAASAAPFFKQGKLRPLGTFSKGGVPGMPEVQSFVDLGYADIEAQIWQGLVVPAATPPAIRARLSDDLQKALKTPLVVSRLQEFGVAVAPSGAAEMQRLWEADAKYWVKLIHDRGISAE